MMWGLFDKPGNARSVLCRPKGITVVEVLIVLAAIALIAVAVSGFLRNKQLSREKAALKDVRAIDSAVTQAARGTRQPMDPPVYYATRLRRLNEERDQFVRPVSIQPNPKHE